MLTNTLGYSNELPVLVAAALRDANLHRKALAIVLNAWDDDTVANALEIASSTIISEDVEASGLWPKRAWTEVTDDALELAGRCAIRRRKWHDSEKQKGAHGAPTYASVDIRRPSALKRDIRAAERRYNFRLEQIPPDVDHAS